LSSDVPTVPAFLSVRALIRPELMMPAGLPRRIRGHVRQEEIARAVRGDQAAHAGGGSSLAERVVELALGLRIGQAGKVAAHAGHLGAERVDQQ